VWIVIQTGPVSGRVFSVVWRTITSSWSAMRSDCTHVRFATSLRLHSKKPL